MKRSTLEVLACPSCRLPWHTKAWQETEDGIETGYLDCRGCGLVIPIIDGFALFTEPLLHAGLAQPAALEALGRTLFGSAEAFAENWRARHQREVIESYAAFHPFNESARSIEPLLPHIEPLLEPDDYVADLWCRTGWSAEWLAGRFPQQRVIALWEGNHSVLGYRGFRHLLGTSQRAPNLDILFTHPERPLPLRDEAFSLIHAHDALHRQALFPFAAEALRITRQNGALLFPHLHLTNSVPESFFDRGGLQVHGRDYRAWLDQVEANGRRRGFVFGESTLFKRETPAELVDDADTGDHNGLIVILPDAHAATPLTASTRAPAVSDHRRYIVSPLFRFDFANGRARVAPQLFHGAVGDLMDRHAVYQERLPKAPVALDDTALLVLLLCMHGLTHAEICAAIPAGETALLTLVSAEIVRSAQVSAGAHRLQRYHALQGAPQSILPRIASSEADQLVLRFANGEQLVAGELSMLRRAWRDMAAARGLRAGDRIAVELGGEPLLQVLAVIAAAEGFDVSIQSIGGTLDAGFSLYLHRDGQAPSPDQTSLPLGLDGSANSLLGTPTPSSELQSSGCVGWISVSLPGGLARLSLHLLVTTMDALSLQIESRPRSLSGEPSVRETLEAIRALHANV